MAIIKCGGCRRDMSDKSPVCPRCKAPNKVVPAQPLTMTRPPSPRRPGVRQPVFEQFEQVETVIVAPRPKKWRGKTLAAVCVSLILVAAMVVVFVAYTQRPPLPIVGSWDGGIQHGQYIFFSSGEYAHMLGAAGDWGFSLHGALHMASPDISVERGVYSISGNTLTLSTRTTERTLTFSFDRTDGENEFLILGGERFRLLDREVP